MNSRRLAVAAVSAASLGLPASAGAAPYDTAVRADDPLVYLRMEDAPGAATALDASAYGRHGTFADATLGVAGPFADSGAAVLLGRSSAVTATVPEASGSAEFWVKPQRLRRNDEAGFVSHGDPSGDGWALGIGAKRKLTFVTRGLEATTRITIPSDVWTMVDATWTATEVRVYVDGALAKTVARSAAAPASSRADLVVGGDGDGAFGGTLVGAVDEVALYRHVLTPAQVSGHRTAASLPTATAAPAITGTLKVGETLSVAPGTWSAASAPFTYQWQRCDADGLDCGDIGGATAATYTLAAADEGATLQVVETATNAAGSSSAVSAPTGVVAAATIDPGTGGGGTDPGTGGGTTDPGTGTTDPGTGTGTGTGTTDPGTGAGTTDPGTGAGTGTTDPGTGTETTGTGGTDGGLTPRTGTPTPTAASCVRLGRVHTSRAAMRKVGRLRLTADGCLRAGAPLRLTLRAKGAKSVRVSLDGKRLKTKLRKGVATSAVKAPRLRPGRHVLTIRVKSRPGKVRTMRVRFTTALS